MKMLSTIRVFFGACVVLFCTAAHADCLLDGASYPEGSVVGDYQCVNGEWVQR